MLVGSMQNRGVLTWSGWVLCSRDEGGLMRRLAARWDHPTILHALDPVGRVTADGAYDGAPTYQTIAAYDDGIKVVIPPRSTAVPSGDPGVPTQRDRHLAMIAEQGRLGWQVAPTTASVR